MEQWKDVIGYEGYYQVSNLGRVKSVNRVVQHSLGGPKKLKSRILRSNLDRYGYHKVHLYKKGIRQTIKIHRLVARAFIGPCPEGQEVRHGLNGKLDNSIDNLCYGTQSENNLDCRRDGTRGRPVHRSDGKEFISMTIAAEEMGCWANSICNVCKGNWKTAGGFGWEYI